MQIGYTLMGEQRGPRQLVTDAVAAERAGFDFMVASDHYSPWLEVQGHAPYTWSVLGAVAQATERIPFMTYVTCPIVRYHPAVVAQKAATVQLLSEGRFSLGLGAGENLNEHVVGQGWPPVDVRHAMLTEAVDIIRSLWEGGFTNFRGQHFQVESAKLYDLPDTLPPIGVAASGSQSTRLAAERGDYLIATEPRKEIVDAYRSAGGTGEVVGQFPVCFGEEAKSLQVLHEQFRWMGLGWKVNSELPGTSAFDSASQFVREEDMSQTAAWGRDVGPYLEKVQAFADAGFTQVALVQVGPEQQEFCDWYASDLKGALGG
ncbi:MAG: F420-dependent oxidoreductase, family [Frankiales bacterium]|nr:F420-dependent oxidoreductase, family [Frankiales bacterium]